MANKEVRVKKGFNFGSMFLGIFLGFVLCIGAIVGVGFFAYHNLSAQWVNNTFKTNLNLGSEELNKKTLKDFATSATNMVKNLNSYTLNNLKADFGVSVSDEIMGLNIADLKDVPLSDIVNKIQEKFSTISAEEIKGVMDLSSMDKILNKYNTYYYNNVDNKLYKDEGLTTVANFAYSISGSVVDVKGATFNITDNKVNIQLRYLPLSTAISDFTSSMGDKITLGELENNYGVDLPEYFDGVDRSVTINQLSAEIDKLQLANFLGYKYDEATEKYYNDKDSDGVFDTGEELSGVINALAYTTVSGISTKIENLTIQDLFNAEDLNSGVLSLIPADTNVNTIDKALETAFEDITLDELIEAEVVVKPTNYDSIKNKYVSGTNVLVKDIKIDDVVSQFVGSIVVSDTPAS